MSLHRGRYAVFGTLASVVMSFVLAVLVCAANSGTAQAATSVIPVSIASHPVSAPVAIKAAAKTGASQIVTGGTWNPGAVGMETFLNGDITKRSNSLARNITPETFGIITTSPQNIAAGKIDKTYDQSRAACVTNMTRAIMAARGPITNVSYSQSASCAAEVRVNLAKAGVPANKVSFVDIGSPRGPNGIEKKFAGITVPFLGATMKGAAPASPYKVTYVSREYGLYEDVPDNLLNPFATANWLIGGLPAHGQYKNVNWNNARAYTEGNTTSVLLKNDRLPLADALRPLGINLNKADTATLRRIVDSGYDRSKYDRQKAPAAPAAQKPAVAVAATPAPAANPVQQVITQVTNFVAPKSAVQNNVSKSVPAASSAPAAPAHVDQMVAQAHKAVDNVNLGGAAPVVHNVINQGQQLLAGFGIR